MAQVVAAFGRSHSTMLVSSEEHWLEMFDHVDGKIVARLRQTMDAMMKDPVFTEQFTKLGFEMWPLVGDQYRDFIVKDLERWKAVAKVANIKIEN